MKFVTKFIETAVRQANIKKDTNIPNEHPLAQHEIGHLTHLAGVLGISLAQFEATRYTYRVVINKDGEKNIYAPYVGAKDGKAVLVWGELKLPLSELQDRDMAIEGDKFIVLEVMDADGCTVELPLMLRKKDANGNPVKYEKSELKTLLRKGRLAEVLAETFTKYIKLADVKPGEYICTSYETYYFKDELKVNLYLENVGLVAGNSYLKTRLSAAPLIDKEHPATVVIRKSTRKTATGYDIIPVELTTAEDREIPAYDFGDDDETTNMLVFS